MRRFHVHVNGSSVPSAVVGRLESAGFTLDDFVLRATSRLNPLHLSFESEDRSAAKLAWSHAGEILMEDPGFTGYVASESVVREIGYSAASTTRCDALALPTLVRTSKPKKADLHLKLRRELAEQTDLMSVLGPQFYRMVTPRNEVFTLQMSTLGGALRVFRLLDAWLSMWPVVDRMTLEACTAFQSAPVGQRVPPVFELVGPRVDHRLLGSV